MCCKYCAPFIQCIANNILLSLTHATKGNLSCGFYEQWSIVLNMACTGTLRVIQWMAFYYPNVSRPRYYDYKYKMFTPLQISNTLVSI